MNAFLNALYESFDRSRDLFSRSFGIDQLIGWLPEIKEQGTVGFSDPVWFSPGRGRVAWVQDTSSPNPLDASDSIAHEIAHNLGARHQSTYFITSSGGVIGVTDRCGSEDDSFFIVRLNFLENQVGKFVFSRGWLCFILLFHGFITRYHLSKINGIELSISAGKSEGSSSGVSIETKLSRVKGISFFIIHSTNGDCLAAKARSSTFIFIPD